MKLTVDNVQYNVLVTSLNRSARIKESKLSGDVKSGRHFRDLVGTYYDYDMEIATDRLSQAEYDSLYEALTAPVESHVVILPYGRTALQFDAYIQSVDDSCIADNGTDRLWGNLSVKFYAIKPQRRPTS